MEYETHVLCLNSSCTIAHGHLESLVSLDLSMTKLVDKHMKNINSLSNLRMLALIGTDIGDDSMAAIAQLKHLEYLYINDTQVTDAGLSRLRDHAALTTLNICSDRISSNGVKILSSVPNLHTLFLGGSRIDGTACKELRHCKKLTYVSFSDCDLTDDVLAELLSDSNIKKIDLHRTKVTIKTIEKLRKRHPGVVIDD